MSLKKSVSKIGYIKIENFFEKNTISELKKDIKTLSKKNVDIYLDKKKRLRRIERLYDKSKNLKDVNKKIISYLNSFFKTKYKIFKDKFNAKPPGGEGFDAHYDGVFSFFK